MNVRITRTKMAGLLESYSYDAYIRLADLSEEHRGYSTHRVILDSDHKNPWVRFEDGIRPIEQLRMPAGIERYDAWKAHEAKALVTKLDLARKAYPELANVTKWPTLWVEIPGLKARHASQYLDYNPLYTCIHCGSINTRWYDGMMGYEALNCHGCHIQQDMNSDNFSKFECPQHGVTI